MKEDPTPSSAGDARPDAVTVAHAAYFTDPKQDVLYRGYSGVICKNLRIAFDWIGYRREWAKQLKYDAQLKEVVKEFQTKKGHSNKDGAFGPRTRALLIDELTARCFEWTRLLRVFEYDVALSYAGEDRRHARALAAKLRARGIRVFFDKYEKATLWGKDLYKHLHSVYTERASHCVIFVSEHYASKIWTDFERKAAQERALKESEYILPIKLDGTQLPGMSRDIGDVNIGEGNNQIAELLIDKLRARGYMEATSDREDTNWPRVLNVVGLVAVVILAAIGANTFRSNSPRNQPDTSLGVSLKSRLDASLGSGQWFAYPDNNPHAIGIKRVPKRFKVDAPLLSVQNDDGTTERGDVVLREGGAHAQLDTPLTTADIPEWQIEAWLAWRQAQRADTKGIGLSPENLDRMFGPSNWRRNPSYSFSAIVDKLQNELRIEYPITSVDADNQKFGVGSPPVRAGLGATVWLAGKIPRVLVPNEISKSFLYPQGAGALQREGTAYTTTLDLTRINRPNAGLCWDFGRPLDIHNEGPFTFMLRTDTAAPVELTFECLGCEGDERMSVVMRDLEAGSFEPITVPTDQLKVGVLRALSRICVALDKKNPSTPSRATVALKMVYVD